MMLMMGDGPKCFQDRRVMLMMRDEPKCFNMSRCC